MHAPDGYDCPFCCYVADGDNGLAGPDCVVERTAETLTLVSPKWWPANPGHLLVVPTRHVESLYDLPDELAVPLQSATRRAALALKAAYGCPGTSTRQHNEPAGDQDVWHYHLHVFPRFDWDDLYGATGRYVPRADVAAAAARVRATMAADVRLRTPAS